MTMKKNDMENSCPLSQLLSPSLFGNHRTLVLGYGNLNYILEQMMLEIYWINSIGEIAFAS